MGEMDLANSSVSNLSSEMKDVSIPSATTDGPSATGKTRILIENWNENLGFYRDVGILKRVINAKATWGVGKGFTADPETTVVLDGIIGIRKEGFNVVMENMIRTMHIAGDSFAEIIRDSEDGRLINLKPLDPSTMVIIGNAGGLIESYEQTSKVKGKDPKKLKLEQVFHLIRNRVADEMHGDSMITALKETILARKEVKLSYRDVMKKYLKPRYIFKLDTDNETKIAAFKTKMDKAWTDGENLYVPKDTVEPELQSISSNATLNPIAYIEQLDNEFYEESGVPRVIVGGSGGFTEGAVKISYLAFQQTIEEDQLFIEEQMGLQLGISLKFDFPASIENELISDKQKDGPVNIDANETTAELEGNQ